MAEVIGNSAQSAEANAIKARGVPRTEDCREFRVSDGDIGNRVWFCLRHCMGGRARHPKELEEPIFFEEGLSEVWEARPQGGPARFRDAARRQRFPSPGEIAPDGVLSCGPDATGVAVPPGRRFPQARGGAHGPPREDAGRTGRRSPGAGAWRAHGTSTGKRSPSRIANSVDRTQRLRQLLALLPIRVRVQCPPHQFNRLSWQNGCSGRGSGARGRTTGIAEEGRQ